MCNPKTHSPEELEFAERLLNCLDIYIKQDEHGAFMIYNGSEKLVCRSWNLLQAVKLAIEAKMKVCLRAGVEAVSFSVQQAIEKHKYED